MEMNMINKGLKPFFSIGETTFIYLQANFCEAFSRNLKKMSSKIIKKLDKIFLMNYMKLGVRKLKKNLVQKEF